MIRANVRTQKSKIDKIGNKLSTLNASGKGANTVRYYDGADPDDIWAVKSAGIDPSNGKELFYAKDGSYTYDFSYDDEVICGNTRPDVEGVLGTSLNWKGLSVSLNFRVQRGVVQQGGEYLEECLEPESRQACAVRALAGSGGYGAFQGYRQRGEYPDVFPFRAEGERVDTGIGLRGIRVL